MDRRGKAAGPPQEVRTDRKAYAFEELVAEIGNCMLCVRLGLTPDFGQSAAYVEGWLEALKADKENDLQGRVRSAEVRRLHVMAA